MPSEDPIELTKVAFDLASGRTSDLPFEWLQMKRISLPGACINSTNEGHQGVIIEMWIKASRYDTVQTTSFKPFTHCLGFPYPARTP